MDELDVYIDKPFGVDNIFCEDESTRKRIKKLVITFNYNKYRLSRAKRIDYNLPYDNRNREIRKPFAEITLNDLMDRIEFN